MDNYSEPGEGLIRLISLKYKPTWVGMDEVDFKQELKIAYWKAWKRGRFNLKGDHLRRYCNGSMRKRAISICMGDHNRGKGRWTTAVPAKRGNGGGGDPFRGVQDKINYADAVNEDGQDGWSMLGVIPSHESHVVDHMALMEAVEQLPDYQKSVVYMKLDDYPPSVIADKMGVSEATCRAYYSRAVRSLQKLMRDNNG